MSLAFLVLAAGGLVYAMTMQVEQNGKTLEELTKERKKESGRYVVSTPRIPGYNPYILNQFVPLKDRIFSADIVENHIHNKPSMTNSGILGLTQCLVKLNPSDPFTVLHVPKSKLNI